MRPLAVASARPAAKTAVRIVDGKTGDDAAAGSEQHPWKTIQHAVSALKPGDTLYIRGGVYFESVAVSAPGTATAPITIRSAPGDVAIVDARPREF